MRAVSDRTASTRVRRPVRKCSRSPRPIAAGVSLRNGPVCPDRMSALACAMISRALAGTQAALLLTASCLRMRQQCGDMRAAFRQRCRIFQRGNRAVRAVESDKYVVNAHGVSLLVRARCSCRNIDVCRRPVFAPCAPVRQSSAKSRSRSRNRPARRSCRTHVPTPARPGFHWAAPATRRTPCPGSGHRRPDTARRSPPWWGGFSMA